ncbi:hypothetical protein ABT093_22565 [Kitasatospora sp. NPDC002551]|uniref:hypothetical protein n=1 Tax=unclassified Kitasatospora TaxID=2633591 RepID=UPI00332AAF13
MISNDAARLGAEAARRLRDADCCTIEPGLSGEEFDRIEASYGFRFADDHRAFLAAGLPVASPPQDGATWKQPWPDWRNGDPDDLRRRLALPAGGVLSSVDHGYWHESWGERPADPAAARSVAEQRLAGVPRLVPLYGHRFLPAGSGTHGHPVLSVWGTDIISYGEDLADYVSREFDAAYRFPAGWDPVATVAFWRDFVE